MVWEWKVPGFILSCSCPGLRFHTSVPYLNSLTNKLDLSALFFGLLAPSAFGGHFAHIVSPLLKHLKNVTGDVNL